MEEVFNQLVALASACQQMSADHGFWHEGKTRNKGEMVALINSELYEAMEGHRKEKWFTGTVSSIEQYVEDSWKSCFQDLVKDSIQDEMADVVIRILDFMEGWKLPFAKFEDNGENYGNNFAEDILQLNMKVNGAYRLITMDDAEYNDQGLDFVLSAVVIFCDTWKIDIITHVKWKMQYNSTRPAMHGKKY